MNGKSILMACMLCAAGGIAAEKLFDGETIIFPKTKSVAASTVIVTKNKKIIVVYGGSPHDHVHLLEVIKKFGDTVTQWYVTHAHDDHAFALLEINKMKPMPIKIEEVLYSFPPIEWIKKCDKVNQEWEIAKRCIDEIPTVPAKQTIVKKGDRFEVDGITVEVMNNYNLDVIHNAVNNASIAFKFHVAGKTVLFPGDLGVEMGNVLVKELGDTLKSDIVLMAHHGQNGVGKNFYELVKPTICVWPLPEWLWENNNGGGPGSGSWRTNYVKCWMQDLGVKKNYVTFKGDVVLQ